MNNPVLTLPTAFYCKEILAFINELFCLEDIKSFDECDDLDKDHLIALGLRAFDGDVDVVFSSEANHLLAKYLLSHDKDDRIELMEALLIAVREQFTPHFTQLFTEMREGLEMDSLRDAGKKPYTDNQNGEVFWR